MSRKRLGRGLDSLLSTQRTAAEQPVIAPEPMAENELGTSGEDIRGGVVWAKLSDIVPSPWQPRRHFDEDALKELADSIVRQGLIQPLLVREKLQGGFELIAGERRLRAANMAGLATLPVIVREVSDEQASALALIENVQREDLTALEEALGLARLRDEFELTQESLAEAVGKPRATIANLLRLLNLGTTARECLERGRFEMGHARALLALTGAEQDTAAVEIAEQRLSVRQAEALVRKIQNGSGSAKPKTAKAHNPELDRLNQRLMDHLGAPTEVKPAGADSGQVVIRYASLDELDGLLQRMGLSAE